MKKKLVSFFILSALTFLYSLKPVFAQVNLPGYEHGEISGWVGSATTLESNLAFVISKILPYFLIFAGLALLIYLLLGGFKLLTSAGSPEQIARGQKMLTNAIVGFLIVISAYWLFQMVKTIFGLT